LSKMNIKERIRRIYENNQMRESSLTLKNPDLRFHEFSHLFSSCKENIDPLLIFLIVIVSLIIVLISIKLRIFHIWNDALRSSLFLRISIYPLLISTSILILGVVFRTILWVRYKPITLDQRENIDWPFVSVIMPAFNEEEMIRISIDSIFDSDYRPEKLEVICINDGSTDSTYAAMAKAKHIYGDSLKVINFYKNAGKRRALYSGIKKSKGEIIITVDCDSRIERSSIKNIVLPLLKNKNIGAVAGSVEAMNKKENLLTRMLSIHYSISFNFGRAYQSAYGTVFCCPGALSAYRKDVLMRFLSKWVNQTFLNTPCTYGEDRSLTTYILKAGFMTRFQSNAHVYTEVPSKLDQLIKMYIRWMRSSIRESIHFAKFMFTEYREKNRFLPIVDFFLVNALHPLHFLSFGIIWYSFFVHPLLILRYLALLVIISFVLSLYYLRTSKSLIFLYRIPYGVITAFCLWWIVLYAAFSMKSQSWLTR
jgi:hyaluronan synthase